MELTTLMAGNQSAMDVCKELQIKFFSDRLTWDVLHSINQHLEDANRKLYKQLLES